MSILSEAYDLIKTFKESPHRQMLKSLLDTLTFTKSGEQNTDNDRSQLGYFARHQYLQTLGFLLLDETQLPISLPKLTQEEKALIGAFHSQLVSLNVKCVSNVVNKLPLIIEAVNPYSEYKDFSFESNTDIVFFDEEKVGKLAQAFSGHPGIDGAIKSVPNDIRQINSDIYVKGVAELKKRLHVAGVHDSPKELVQISFSRDSNDQNLILFRHLVSLVTIRTSLELLNQLLFQAAQFERLTIFDEENVIKILNNTINVVGQGVTLAYQIDARNFIIDPNDLVLFNGSIIDRDKILLGWVQDTNISFSEESGNIGELSVWLLDENLNPFSGLVGK